jgi:hypothetical protein
MGESDWEFVTYTYPSLHVFFETGWINSHYDGVEGLSFDTAAPSPVAHSDAIHPRLSYFR